MRCSKEKTSAYNYSYPGHAMAFLLSHAMALLPGHAVATLPGHAVATLPGHAMATLPGHAMATRRRAVIITDHSPKNPR